MENLKLVTEIDNLTPALPKRSTLLKKRSYAFIIDLYAIVFINKFMSYIWMGFVNKYIANISIFNSKSSSLLSGGITNISLPIVFFSYFFFFYYLGEGQTIGKIIFKLKVYSNTSKTSILTAKEALSRSLGYLFCNYLFYIPFAINFLRKDMVGVNDFISSTSVYTEEEIAVIHSLEEKSLQTAQMDMFPEDPVTHRLLDVS